MQPGTDKASRLERTTRRWDGELNRRPTLFETMYEWRVRASVYYLIGRRPERQGKRGVGAGAVEVPYY